MHIWYPPWANKWKTVDLPSWTVKDRHLWMSDALHLRRKIQALNNERDELQHYDTFLSHFYESFDWTDEEIVVEILSDGLGDVEPHWHGLKIGRGGIYILPEWMHKKLVSKVAERRTRVKGRLAFETHLKIGERLFEPTLFKITQTEVKYYSGNRWCDLDDPKSPIPLMLTKDNSEKAEWDKMEQIASNLHALFQDEEYKKVIEEIRTTLSALSEAVLWPALLDSEKKKGELLSLVLIQASAWQVPGVWALHAFSPKRKVAAHATTELGLVKSIIDPPMLCLYDVLGATFRRDSTHEQRKNDVRLFMRCKGITWKFGPEEEFYDLDENDQEIYDRPLSADPFERYGMIYQKAREKYAKDVNMELPISQPNDILLVWLEKALKQAFVAWASQAESPLIAKLLIQDTVRLCLAIIGHVASANDSGIRHPQVVICLGSSMVSDAQRWLQSLDLFVEHEEAFHEHKEKLAKLLICSLLCVSLNNPTSFNDEAKKWLSWCGYGLRVLIFSTEGTGGLSARQKYNEWQQSGAELNAGQSALFKALQNAGLDNEAIWFIIELIPA